MFYVYRITNNLNGKTYIGQHKSKKLDDGYFGSGTAINRAIKKYGKENFTKEILEVCSEEDVNDLEIKYIQEEKEKGKGEYNIAGGGQGCTNPFQYKSEEERQAIWKKAGLTRRGKPSGSSGKTWKQKKHTSTFIPEPVRIKVRCLETGEVFNSIRECAKKFNIDSSWLAKVLKSGKNTSKGYHFETVGEVVHPVVEFFHVKCLENGKIYRSINEAADDLNLRDSGISAVLRGAQKTTGTYHFEKIPVEKSKKVGKPIVVMELDKCFDSFDDCAEFLKCNRGTIFNHLAGETNTCMGYHICYKENYNKDNNQWLGKEPNLESINKPKKVRCIETGEVFSSIRAAGKKLGIDSGMISAVCNKYRKTAHKLSFEFV